VAMPQFPIGMPQPFMPTPAMPTLPEVKTQREDASGKFVMDQEKTMAAAREFLKINKGLKGKKLNKYLK